METGSIFFGTIARHFLTVKKITSLSKLVFLSFVVYFSFAARAGAEILFFKSPVSTKGSYVDGVNFCHGYGGHMPSVREWAQIAMKFGAKGIVEFDAKSSLPGPDFKLIKSPPDKNGKVVQFYYSNLGFHGNGNDLVRGYDPDFRRVRVGNAEGAPSNEYSFDIGNGEFSYFGLGQYDDQINVCIQDADLKLQSCSSLDPKSAADGTQCRTTIGGIYTKVRFDGFGAAWKDPAGRIWSSQIPQSPVTFEDAGNICFKIGEAFFKTSEGAKLKTNIYASSGIPHRDSLLAAVGSGLNEILPDLYSAFWADDYIGSWDENQCNFRIWGANSFIGFSSNSNCLGGFDNPVPAKGAFRCVYLPGNQF